MTDRDYKRQCFYACSVEPNVRWVSRYVLQVNNLESLGLPPVHGDFQLTDTAIFYNSDNPPIAITIIK